MPVGFQCTAHPIFFDYLPPCVEVNVLVDEDGDEEEKSSKREKPLERTTDVMDKKSSSDIDLAISTVIPALVCDKEQCSICLSPHVTPITLVSCCHSFCRDCVLVWFRKKRQCPLCKCTAKHFVQSKQVSEDDETLSSNEVVKVWAICEGTDYSNHLEPIHRTDVSPAIRAHTERFLSPSKSLPEKKVRRKRSPDVTEKTSKSIPAEQMLSSDERKLKLRKLNIMLAEAERQLAELND